MKCKHCDGDGVIVDVEYGHAGKYGCKYCDGKGVVEPLTNEEWLKSMNTEQFAEALAWIEDRGELPTVRKENVKAFEKWLKQPHTTE